MRPFIRYLLLSFLLSALAACGGGSSDGGSSDSGGSTNEQPPLPTEPNPPSPNPPVEPNPPEEPVDPPPVNPNPSDEFSATLPVLHEFDAQKAAQGKAQFQTHTLSNGVIPELGIRNLWPAWCSKPTEQMSCAMESINLFSNDAAYWTAFRARYGFQEAPFNNDGLPLGMRKTSNGSITLDCMMCHAGKVAGNVIIGAPNTTIDLQALIDDLAFVNSIASIYGFVSFPVPFMVTNKTGAAGITDAVGIGFEATQIPGLNTFYGYQRPGAWWAVKHKNTLYSDGSGKVSGTGYRLMTATLIALGESYNSIQTRDDDFKNILNYILSIESPQWPQIIDSTKAARGMALFEAKCASCHGDNQGFPDKLVSNVGTDSQRAQQLTNAETNLINLSWFGETPMTATNAYVAPPLTGIWARAPYFHNGSVPTLKGVLLSSERPDYWVRTGSETTDYDFTNVGWNYTVGIANTDRSTHQGRRTYDTTQTGMSNSGHTYGDSLTQAQRNDLIEFLKTL